MNKRYVIMGTRDINGDPIPILKIKEGATLREAELKFHSFCYHPTEAEECLAKDIITMWLEEESYE